MLHIRYNERYTARHQNKRGKKPVRHSLSKLDFSESLNSLIADFLCFAGTNFRESVL